MKKIISYIGDGVKMTKQFKHEPDGYIPLLDTDNGELIRPYWIKDDEVLLYFPNLLGTEKKSKIKKCIKINTLTKEELIKYQKEGRIPIDYKLEE